MNFAPNTIDLKVLTPDGYKSFAGIAHMGDKPLYEVLLEDGSRLECTRQHRLFQKGLSIPLEHLDPGDIIDTQNGSSVIVEINDLNKLVPVYDLIEVADNRRYYTNKILSSNCKFVTEDETLVDPLALAGLSGVDELFKIGEVRWYDEPKPNHVYVVALDPSLGTGRDFSAIQILELPSMLQIGEWKHNKTSVRDQVKILRSVLSFLHFIMLESEEQEVEPEIYWTVENNSIGEAALVVIEDTGEENFPGVFMHEPKKSGGRRGRKGLTTTNRSKLAACTKLKSLIESNRVTLKSKGLIKELKSFVRTGSGFAAKYGENDDLISGMLLSLRVVMLLADWDPDLVEHLKDNAMDDDDYGVAPLPMSF